MVKGVVPADYQETQAVGFLLVACLEFEIPKPRQGKLSAQWKGGLALFCYCTASIETMPLQSKSVNAMIT